ncbi:MAG: response regulator [Curvibacter sp.]|jgi:two-component system sensor histidine kinase/response regulator|nr:MAG: response regulator [Curvibacter sp.]
MNTSKSTALRVLAADDNPVNQKLIVAALKQLGHQGVVVSDGEKALRCLSQLSFDVLLLDVQMPVMDGLEALASIRKQELQGKPHLPVIMVTANDVPGDRERYLKQGADGYVAKPVDIALLDAEIKRVLRRL